MIIEMLHMGMPLTKVNDNELHEGYSDRCCYSLPPVSTGGIDL